MHLPLAVHEILTELVTSFIASQLKLLFLFLHQNYNSFPDLSSDAKLNDDVDDDDDDVEGLAAAVPRHEALPRPAWWDPYLHLFLSLQKTIKRGKETKKDPGTEI